MNRQFFTEHEVLIRFFPLHVLLIFLDHQLIQTEKEWCTKAYNVDVHVDAITYDLLIKWKFDCQKSNRNVHPLTFSVIFRFIIEFKQFAAWVCSCFYSSFCCAWFWNTIMIMRNVQYILTSSLRLHLFEHHFGIHHMNVDWHPSHWCVSNIWKCWTFISSHALKVPTISKEK